MQNEYKIPLVKDTIKNSEIDQLRDWLGTYPQLTKGKLTNKFESKWANWNGNEHSIFVNSGSSALLLMFYAYRCMTQKQNIKVVAPAVSWVTTVAPIMQLGMEPILCDCNMTSLGLDINHLEEIFKKENPDALILVHVLGHQNEMDIILDLCSKYDVTLFEDCCEAPGTSKNNKKVGTYGFAGCFSFYYGHHMSTIEGGIVVTNNANFSNIMKSIRSHGWSRDLDETSKNQLKLEHKIDDFKDMYTFYYPGFNLRSTDLNAFVGINQIDTLDEKVKKRFSIYKRFKEKLEDYFWIQSCDSDIISNFALGLIVEDIPKFVKELDNKSIQIRPLICGSIGEQPFWIKEYGIQKLPNATKVHNNGIYLPAHQDLTDDDIEYVGDSLIEILKL